MFKSYADEFDASDKTLSIQQQLSGMSNAIIKLLSFADDLRQDNDRKDEQIQKLEMRVTDLESYIRRMDCSLTQSSVGQKDSFTERKYLDMSESEGGSDSSIEEYLNTDQTQIDANEKKPTCADNIITVELDKMNYSFGIKIVGVNQGPKRKGIYVKAILPDGPAELDGRLQPGDGILEVNGISVKDLSQNEFVQILRGTSHVTLKVERDAAELYHEKKNFQSLRDQPNCAPQASAEAKETVEKCTKCNGTGKRTGLLPLTGFPMLTPIAVTCKDCEGQGIIRKTTISEGKTEHHTEVSFKATPPSYDDVVQKFTTIQKARPQATVSGIRANMAQQNVATAKNRRLAQQMENRPSVMAALKLKQKSMKQRLGQGSGGTSNVKSRLNLSGVRGRGRGFSRGSRGYTRSPRSRGRGRGRGGFNRSESEGGDEDIISTGRGRGGMRGRGRGRGGRGFSRGRGQRGGRGQSRRGSGWGDRGRGFDSPRTFGRGGRGQRGGSRGGGRFSRGSRGGRGRGRGRGGRGDVKPSVEELDNQLDEYMSKTKTHLDFELDAYMQDAQA